MGSVVDRRVAQIGSCAIAKTVRARNKQFIAVSCHYDIEDWLQPDWIYEPALERFRWRSLCPRPSIAIDIERTTHHAWRQFAPHHYLSAKIHKGAHCYLASIDGTPAAFDSFINFFGKLGGLRTAMRVHRLVTLPDFQGLGIGAAMNATIASAYAAIGQRVFLGSSHPALIASSTRSSNWIMTKAPGSSNPDRGHHARSKGLATTRAVDRFVASFEYAGPRMEIAAARRLLG